MLAGSRHGHIFFSQLFGFCLRIPLTDIFPNPVIHDLLLFFLGTVTLPDKQL